MKIYIASDHGGLEAKEHVIEVLESLSCTFEDLGPNELDSGDDYPYYARKVCDKVLVGDNSLGILICGSGTGVAIASNKVNGIRAVQGYDSYSAKMARLDENANVLCLRAKEFDQVKYYDIIREFLETDFTFEERHNRRLKELEAIELSNRDTKE